MRKDIINQRFGKLLIISFSHIDKTRAACWNAICDCGNKCIVRGISLRADHVNSCGCLGQERRVKSVRKHGMYQSRIYHIWVGIKQRCTNPKNINYSHYGGRGITLCPEWQTFEGFYAANGESYNKHVAEFGEKNTTADRYPDVNGNYEPNNFRWATRIEQDNNTTNSVHSENKDEHDRWKMSFGHMVASVFDFKIHNSPLFEKYLGCSIPYFREYIFSQFGSGMTLDNHGKYTLDKPEVWNIDHIDPCHDFDLSKEKDRLVCFNYKNLCPMWGKDNNYKR